jgi:hypothetical protein
VCALVCVTPLTVIVLLGENFEVITSFVLFHASNGILNFAPTYLYVPSTTSTLPEEPELLDLLSSSEEFEVLNIPINANIPIKSINKPKHTPIIIAFTFNDKKLNTVSVKSFALLSDIYLPPPTKYSFSQSNAFTFIKVCP